MQIQQEQVTQILQVHNSLWNALYDFDSDPHTLHYKGTQYSIKISADRGYASVVLPNPKGINFMWITQNLHKSTYGTVSIQRAREQNQDHRITWIVDTHQGAFKYRSNITTTVQDSIMIDGAIEIYDNFGTEIVWSNNPKLTTTKAEF